MAKCGGVFMIQRKIAGQHTFIMENTELKKTAFMLLKEKVDGKTFDTLKEAKEYVVRING